MTPQDDVIPRARADLNDTVADYRTSDADLLRRLNDALDVLVDIRPDLFLTTVTHACTTGAEQTLTAARVRKIIDVPRIVGGAAVLPTSRPMLDAFMPTWYSVSASAAKNWMPHEVLTKFYLYPPAANTQSVEVRIAQAPAELGLADTIPVPDNYLSALVDYVVASTNTKEDEGGSLEKRTALMNDFVAKVKAQ